jgi:excisionase family DNA binding protein
MLNVEQTAKRLNVSTATIYGLVNSGQLRCHRIGTGRGVIRVSEDNIREFLASSQSQTSVPPSASATKKFRNLKI